jgi:hypothetical protein
VLVLKEGLAVPPTHLPTALSVIHTLCDPTKIETGATNN